MFSFSWSSINCSTETMSANLKTLIDSEEAAKVVIIHFGKPCQKAGKPILFFFTSEIYRMTNHRPLTIFFTSEKNRMTNQIVSSL